MKWVVVLLIMCGLFYAAKQLMPSATAIDTLWMSRQIRIGMTKEEVAQTIGGDANTIAGGGMGHDETWYYTDRYNENQHLAIQFIDGHVYRASLENDKKIYGSSAAN